MDEIGQVTFESALHKFTQMKGNTWEENTGTGSLFGMIGRVKRGLAVPTAF